MRKVKASELRVRSQVLAETKLAKTSPSLSKAMQREMEDRDPNYDRLDAAVDRKN